MRFVHNGGGAGVTVPFKGVRPFATQNTANIVTTDSGRSTGVVRQKIGPLFNQEVEVAAPGDVRNAICELATRHRWWAEMFQKRLKDGSALGNLILGMGAKENSGSMEEAIEAFNELFLPSYERVWPSSLDPDIHIEATLVDGTVCQGETQVRAPSKPRIVTPPRFNHPSGLYWRVGDDLREADCITWGPGSWYSSIMPTLLYTGFVDTVMRNRKAAKVLILNTTTQTGQTDGWTPYDHVKMFLEAAGEQIIDYVLFNVLKPPEEVFARLRNDGREYLRVTSLEAAKIESLKVRVCPANLIDISGAEAAQWKKDDAIIYHRPSFLGEAIRRIIRFHLGIEKMPISPDVEELIRA